MKYVDCHNCKNIYDCERTYLGGCTDGEEWGDDNESDGKTINTEM